MQSPLFSPVQAPVTLPRELRILVVEDEALVALNLEDMLIELNAVVSGVAATVDEAVEKLGGCNAAILDYRLHDLTIEPIAADLEKRGVPFAVASGSDIADMAARFPSAVMLGKPYSISDVEHALSMLQARLHAA